MDVSKALNYSTAAIEDLETQRKAFERRGWRETASAYQQISQLMREALKFNLPDHGDLVALDGLDESFSDFVRLPFEAACLETPFSKVAEPFKGGAGRPQVMAEQSSSKRVAVCWTNAVAHRFPLLCPRGLLSKGFYVASVYYADDEQCWSLCPTGSFFPEGLDIRAGTDAPTNPAQALELEFRRERGTLTEGASTYDAYPVKYCPEVIAMFVMASGDQDAALARLALDLHDECRTAIGFCLTINASNIKRQRIEAPAKLNKKRLSSGKTPFYDAWILDLGAAQPGGRGDSDGASGRAGPRMHLRRGHIRRLGPDRITFVRTAAVGRPEQGAVQKVYKVR